MQNRSILLLAVLLIATVFLSFGAHGLFFTKKLNPCLMTYMYPSYHVVRDAPTDLRGHGYSLYLYREAIGHPKVEVDGVPVLFIPGNAGFYAQVRSIASVTSHLRLRSQARELDFFSLNFNEELSGFSGRLLEDQIHYANQCIRHILGLYQGQHAPSSVIVLGHSMGGFVARALLFAPNYLENSVKMILTLATPHRHAPIYIDSAMYRLYSAVNAQWEQTIRLNNSNLSLVSIAGGGADTLVRSDFAFLPPPPREGAFYSTSTLQMPNVWLSPDHLCVLWCNQLVVQISEFLGAYVDSDRTQSGDSKTALISKYFASSLAAHAMTTGPPLRIKDGVSVSLTIPLWAKSVIIVSKVKFSVTYGVNRTSLPGSVLPSTQFMIHYAFPSSSSAVSNFTIKIPARSHYTIQYLNVTLPSFYSLPSPSSCAKLQLIKSKDPAKTTEHDYCLPFASVVGTDLLSFVRGQNLANFTLEVNHPAVWSVTLPAPQLQYFPVIVLVEKLGCSAVVDIDSVLHVSTTDEHVLANITASSEAIPIQFFSSSPSGAIVTLISDPRCSIHITIAYDRLGTVIHLLRMMLPLLPSVTLGVAFSAFALQLPRNNSMTAMVVLVGFLALCVCQVPTLLSNYDWVDRGGAAISPLFVVALFLASFPIYVVVWLLSFLLTACGRRCFPRVLRTSLCVTSILGMILLIGVVVHFGCGYLLLLLLLSASPEALSVYLLPVLLLASPPAFASVVLSVNSLSHGTTRLWSPLFACSTDSLVGFLSAWLVVYSFVGSSAIFSSHTRAVAWLSASICFLCPMLPFFGQYCVLALLCCLLPPFAGKRIPL